MHYKRLLVISHNCFSKSGSNGRTLANYLMGWPKESIAQFYIHAEQPDFDICNQYFCLTDFSLLKSIVSRQSAGYAVKSSENNTVSVERDITQHKKRCLQNSLTFLTREFAWRSCLWNSTELEQWIEKFRPEVILVQAGDAGFLFSVAIFIGNKYQTPIIVYNTEGYYFKKISYLPENIVSRLLYPCLNNLFRKSYDELVRASVAEIYNCDLLRDAYKNVLRTDSRVIMNISELADEEVVKSKKNQFIYAGNLGLNRHKSLIEFAYALQSVSPGMTIDVYGKVPNDGVRAELENCLGVTLHGFISYEELQQKLRESKYLLHVESFDPFYREDLKYAFSTKIADSLAVGACLFVYAPKNMAVVKYLEKERAAVLITDPKMLKKQISHVLNDDVLGQTYATNGRLLAIKNHSVKKNREAFQSILLGEGVAE